MKRVVLGIIERKVLGKKQYLLVSATKKSGKYTGFYYPPGGHMKEGEEESETIIREIREELGYEVKVLNKITESMGDTKNQLTYWWLCKIIKGKLRIKKEEIINAKWFSEKEIIDEEKIWPATKEVFINYIFKKNI